MPGGVGGAQLIMAAPYPDSHLRGRALESTHIDLAEGLQMLKIVFLRNLFLSVLVLLLALVAYIHFAVFPAFNRLLVANTEDQAKRVATHLASMLLSEKQALSGASL